MARIDFECAPFFRVIDPGGLPPRGSLEGASGQKSDPGPYPTNLVEECETAWRTPFRELTCAQVSTLAGQRMGLEWLGRPAIAFAVRYPLATIRNYPGEMGVSCLRAAAELSAFAQPDFGEWLKGSFAWLDRVRDWSPKFRDEVKNLLAAAREAVRAQ